MLFEVIKQELRRPAEAAEQLGLSETGFAIYGLLVPPGAKLDDAKKELAHILEDVLEQHVSIVDWIHKDDVQREMRRLIKRQLKAASYPADQMEVLAESVVDLLKRRRRP
jgi:type I restriction enzyme, R subunit